MRPGLRRSGGISNLHFHALLALVFVLSMAAGGDAGCGGCAAAAEPSHRAVIGFLRSSGPIDDGGFNQGAYSGALRAAKAVGVELKLLQPATIDPLDNIRSQIAETRRAARSFLNTGGTFIVMVGSEHQELLRELSTDFPDRKFAWIDDEFRAPNVMSVVFREEEAAFLAGALAAKTTKSGRLGTIAGADVGATRRFTCGFVAGARRARPDIVIQNDVVGDANTGWSDPAKGKALAVAQITAGADVVFQIAGQSGNGVFAAIAEAPPGHYAIGVDLNQNDRVPGRVLTSVLKRIDVAVSYAIDSFFDGRWSPDTVRLGLQQSAVDWVVDKSNRKLITPAVESYVSRMKLLILQGQLDPVTDHPACREVP